MGSSKDEGDVLLVALGDEWTVRCSHPIRMGFDIPSYGPDRKIKHSRMDVAFPHCHDCGHLPRCASSQLATPISCVPRSNGTASPSWLLPAPLVEGTFPRVVARREQPAQ